MLGEWVGERENTWGTRYKTTKIRVNPNIEMTFDVT